MALGALEGLDEPIRAELCRVLPSCNSDFAAIFVLKFTCCWSSNFILRPLIFLRLPLVFSYSFFPWVTLGITYHCVLPVDAVLAEMRQWRRGALLLSPTGSLLMTAKNWPVGAPQDVDWSKKHWIICFGGALFWWQEKKSVKSGLRCLIFSFPPG